MKFCWPAQILLLTAFFSGVAQADHLKDTTVQGTAKVLTGSVLSIDKKRVVLFGINGISIQSIPWGPRARSVLMFLVAGKKVICKLDSHTNQSEIAKCKVGKIDLADTLVRNGLASADREQSDDYLAAERAAAKAKAGFWK